MVFSRPLHLAPRRLAAVGLLAALYFITGKLSFLFSQQHLIVTIVLFIPEGIALAALIRHGAWLWPGIFLGQLALAWSAGVPLPTAASIGAVNSLEGVMGAWLFHHNRLDPNLPTLRDTLGLLALVALVLQPFSALFGNLSLMAAGILDAQALPANLFSWWLGNVLGQALVTPTLLLAARREGRASWGERFYLVLLFGLLTWILFFLLPLSRLSAVFAITLPLVILVTLGKGRVAGMLTTAVLALGALLATRQGLGPFSWGDTTENLLDLNFYLLSHLMLVLIIGTLFHEKQASERKLLALALRDPLTGLPSRNLLEERMHHAIALAHRFGKKSAVLFIDLDGFKAINDRFGHDAGDRVIQEVARRLEKPLQEDDSLIRLGGDEFLMIATDTPNRQAVEALLTRIHAAMAEPIDLGGHQVPLTLSIGVSLCPDDGDDMHSLITKADAAMYQAKRAGKARYLFHGGRNAA